MTTCTTCNWKYTCLQRTSGNALRCHDWEPARKPMPSIDLGLAIALGLLFWAALIYFVPLAILAAKGFGG